MRKQKRRLRLGLVKFSGLGGFRERFIGKIIEEDIPIYEISENNEYVYGTISPTDYLRVARIGRKHGVKTRVMQRKGIYFTLQKNKKRWGLVTGALCALAVITVMSQFVWDIEISGNEKVSDIEILRVMEENGVFPGAQTKSFDTRLCERNAMLRISELSWINVECEGSRVYVKVAETDESTQTTDISINTPCNIVSDYDGQVISTTVRKGRLMVEKGSGVRKGQILVSGAVNDNGGHNVYLHSDADILLRCEQTEEFYVTFNRTEKVPSGEINYSSYIMFGDYSISLPWCHYNADDDNFVYNEDIHTITFFGINTPFRYKTGIYEKYTDKTVTSTNSDVINILEKKKSDYEKNFLHEAEIISAEKTFIPDENGIKLSVKYILDRNVGTKQEISILYR